MSPSLGALLDPRPQPGKPPIAHAELVDDASDWVAGHRDALRAAVTERGAVLVRGLGLRDAAGVAEVAARLGGGFRAARAAFAPRTPYQGGLYSSTTWPANQPMCMHHELSYAREFPALMLFACLTASAEGGATGVADASAVLEALPPALVERFEREGWMLTRCYNDEIGASWTDSFGTDDGAAGRAAVERYCREGGIGFTWLPDGGLQTRQRRPAVVRHPITGRRCWFNQIAFLNEWTLAEEVREYLVDEYGPDGLPFNTRFGNGDPIDARTVALIDEVYQAHTAREPWQAGDLLLVDNIGTAHSREAFTGPREVLVGMVDPIRLDGR
jgi:hypothetical protein